MDSRFALKRLTDMTSEADDVLDFLSSLPESDRNKIVSQSEEKNEDILSFLNELEKDKGTDNPKGKEDKKVEETPTGKETEIERDGVNESEKKQVSEGAKPEKVEFEKVEFHEPQHGSEIQPSTEIQSNSWWSNPTVSSLWGTAQTLKESAAKNAEEMLNRAKAQNLEKSLADVFREVGITGVDTSNLSEHDKEQVLQLPTLGSLNKGIGFVSDQLSSVLAKVESLEFGDGGSGDEFLDIQLIHDLKNYAYLKNLVGSNFNKVMGAQVDGDIRIKVSESHQSSQPDDVKKSLGLFHGKLSDCEKLVLASLDEPALLLKPDDNDLVSHILVGLQAVTVPSSATSDDGAKSIYIDSYSPGSFCFVCVLKDLKHDITITNKSQPLPLKWAKWLDGEMSEHDAEKSDVDPSEWVKNWVADTLNLQIGVLAQSYVIKRMEY